MQESSQREGSDESRAVLVGVSADADLAADADESLAELGELARTAKITVVGELLQVREKPHGATYIGSGKLKELGALAEAREAGLVIFDNELSPTQIKNIEDALDKDVRVIDRTMLILDIFAANATTNEGMLQVEIAQLKYNIPRLVGKGAALSRLGGGIGTRGPGESQLESDRRHARRRIASLEKKLAALCASRDLRRQARRGGGLPQIAIAGYTNAGKSTLLNALTDAKTLAEDKLFATLDPTTRRMKLPSAGEVLFTDTVGFIDRLPHHLIEAFASTLDEVAYADVLLVLFDAANPNLARQIEVTRDLLSHLYEAREVQAPPTVFVYNKCDLAQSAVITEGVRAAERCVCISAKTGEGIGEMLAAIEDLLARQRQILRFCFPRERADALDLLYRTSRVTEVTYTDAGIVVTAAVDERVRGKFAEYIR